MHVFDETGVPHHPPHCHVRWPGGWIPVALPKLAILVDAELPKAAGQLLDDHIDEIIAAWNRLNPGRPIR